MKNFHIRIHYNGYFASFDIKSNDTLEDVEKTMIKPKKGLMVLFDGNKKVHSVNKINKGPRYTISCWYTK